MHDYQCLLLIESENFTCIYFVKFAIFYNSPKNNWMHERLLDVEQKFGDRKNTILEKK